MGRRRENPFVKYWLIIPSSTHDLYMFLASCTDLISLSAMGSSRRAGRIIFLHSAEATNSEKTVIAFYVFETLLDGN